MVKLWHIMDGLYISNPHFQWEFLTTLSYEWSVIRGHRPYRWPIWIYSLTRIFALLTVIVDIVMVDTVATDIVGCHAAFVIQFVFSHFSISTASILIQLRILAIWNRNKVVVAIAAIIWFANSAILIQGTVQFRAVWVSDREGCAILDINGLKLIIVAAFVTDTVLLLIMFLGLLRMGLYGSDTLALGRVMWKQGVLWVLLAVIIEVPPTVLVCLNLNDVPEALADIDVNRRNTDASRSDKFWVLGYLLRKCPKQRSPAFNPKSQGYSCDTPSASPDTAGCKHGQRGISCVTCGPPWPVHERGRAAADRPRVPILDRRLRKSALEESNPQSDGRVGAPRLRWIYSTSPWEQGSFQEPCR
ncbi:hypothetical protein BC826DRAFT_1189261 [Russula brevipes]|nr:hypothetical protein BC826DRAFT_1189261 [Russula brevipes]